MKSFFVGCFCLINLLVFAGAEKSSMAITKLVRNGATIELSISADKPYYVGGNLQVLYIGNKHFTHSKFSESKGKHIITFLIPQADYALLKEGDAVWMTYGEITRGEQEALPDMEAYLKANPKSCWKLGKLHKKLSK
jgi:hypothetical protein